MDPVNSPLGRMLLDEITPVVMVLRTNLVEESCQKNGLSLIEMLSPFCAFNNIDVPVRTASDQPYRIQKFKLRLFYASDIQQPNVEVAKERLKQAITHAGEKDYSDLCSDPPQIETVLASTQSELVPSWFPFFNKELVHTVSFSDHEALDHPVACLLVVSSKDNEPINKFVDLFNTDQLPSLLNDGAMDPKILKYYLLLHDSQDGTSEKATKYLTEMRNTFGSNDCGLLCINSSQDGLFEHQENPWALYKTESSPSQRLGCFLNIDDMDELQNSMQDLSSKHIIPHMEQKIRVLNQQVSATRKGLRNQIKNLWWRKGKEDMPESFNGLMYTFSSIESQIRVLADYAFMLRDYELAVSNYRLLSTDYKLDKAWKRYAGVQEMMGLTYFMLDQSRKEAEYCMENAFNTYLKIGLAGQRNATRCGLWWAEMLKTRDQFKEAATVYFRISGEEPPLHSAVMLEQGSYCYLFAKTPMLRKYGFHLVLSGDLYKKCDQIKHAIRTYRGALTVFKETKWSHIRDHVHFHIGKWYAILGLFDVAINHIMEVLACSHQSKKTQELFLRDFFQVVQKTGKTFEVLGLQLPVIDTPSLKVVFEDHRTYASPEAVSVKESLWRSLEEDMIPALSTIKSNWLDLQPKLLPKKHKESNVCVAGEAVKIEIGFKNPLQIPISISGASLICEHSTRSDKIEADATSLTNENGNNDRFRNIASSGECSSDASSFIVSEVDISLGGGETLLVQLSVTPKLEGTLKIVGVRWKLSGSVAGFYNFNSDLVKKKVAKRRSKMKQSMTDNLEFMVIKALPKVEGFIRHLPKTVYAGDLRSLDLVLKNPSAISVKNMKMKISHPRFLIIGNQEVMDREFPACLEKKTNSDAQAKTNYASDTVFQFPEDALIHGETPFVWPLWIRAATHGNISMDITVYYEMGDTSTVMNYRTLRIHYNLEVLPSLDVSFQISPCSLRLGEFLVRMDVVNRTSSKNFQIHQLSSVGNEWEISLLQPIDAIFPSELLLAGQALSCFFKLKNSRKSVLIDDENSSTAPLEGSDVSLSHRSHDLLFDICRSPLVDFHHSERVHQGMENQEKSNTVDFILISRQQRSEGDSEEHNSLNILSHHACACSIASTSPVWWLVEGPRTIHHNFSASICEIKLRMTIRNSSKDPASIRIDPSDSTSIGNTTSVSSGNEAGWYDISLLNDVKVTSDVLGTRSGKSLSRECVSLFIWSGMSSNRIKLEPMSTTEIPLQICVFSPGTYDLSNYFLHWKILPSNEHVNQGDGTRQSSGTCQGHPYFLTVLQSS
ncbi:Trafficking protein particle complex subunit like [Actinidia chinensis var. chinensis]|uniref:Trafficking protein particle complex subunit like n=1 Tax=Actinidia chinensis var. chinensis TaxID=1590841 RepID=A0A2R6QVU3_ACTCC|nr:Trafficking protein particle complex subunit like [Actinidia chinensis var. chinensis]